MQAYLYAACHRTYTLIITRIRHFLRFLTASCTWASFFAVNMYGTIAYSVLNIQEYKFVGGYHTDSKSSTL